MIWYVNFEFLHLGVADGSRTPLWEQNCQMDVDHMRNQSINMVCSTAHSIKVGGTAADQPVWSYLVKESVGQDFKRFTFVVK